MKRTFLGIRTPSITLSPAGFNDKELSEIVDGIQEKGGDIISVSISPTLGRGFGEHLLIFYEDNGNNSSIRIFLESYKYKQNCIVDKRGNIIKE